VINDFGMLKLIEDNDITIKILDIDDESINENGKVSIDIKKELDKLKNETLKELKEILFEIEKTA
jgi:hypothetical protein